MPNATEVVSARVDRVIKARAGSVLARRGLTFSEAISNMLAAIARAGEVPEVALAEHSQSDSSVARIASIRERVPSLLPPMSRAQIKSELEHRDA